MTIKPEHIPKMNIIEHDIEETPQSAAVKEFKRAIQMSGLTTTITRRHAVVLLQILEEKTSQCGQAG